MDKETLKYVNSQLTYIRSRLSELRNTVLATEYTINKRYVKENEDEEPTIEDEIMSCLKDFINGNDSFKNVKIKVVKVDEDDD